MNKIKQRVRISIKDYPDEVKATQWVNLWFMKNGKSIKGTGIFPSEQEAKKSADEWLAKFGHLDVWLPYQFKATDVSHHIQIPLVDK